MLSAAASALRNSNNPSLIKAERSLLLMLVDSSHVKLLRGRYGCVVEILFLGNYRNQDVRKRRMILDSLGNVQK